MHACNHTHTHAPMHMHIHAHSHTIKGHPRLVKALAKMYSILHGREINPMTEVCASKREELGGVEGKEGGRGEKREKDKEIGPQH